MRKPNSVNILGINYTIQYVANPAEVDMYKRESLWGQIDFWTRSIRIYDNGRSMEDILQTIFHEVIHGIVCDLHMKAFNSNTDHEEIDLLALGLTDVLVRNGWICLEENGDE